MKELPKFKAGDRVWSVLRNCWVELQREGDELFDGAWYYTKGGSLLGSENPIPMLFLSEVKPEDWLQPEPPRPNLEVDAPVMVRDDNNTHWVRQHFADWDDAKICCWGNGCTSFTATCQTPWKYWRLPTEEELRGGCDA